VVLEYVLKECVRLPDNRVVSKAEALVLRAQHGALKGDTGAIKVLDPLAEKLELTKPCENPEGRKYGYLVVPRKLPRDEWEKVAARALKHNLEPDPRFKRPEELVKIARRANRGEVRPKRGGDFPLSTSRPVHEVAPWKRRTPDSSLGRL
jgi:hypothetical protein